MHRYEDFIDAKNRHVIIILQFCIILFEQQLLFSSLAKSTDENLLTTDNFKGSQLSLWRSCISL
jgi:hypothetical protein